MYFPWILLTSGLKLYFYGFPSPWDHFNPVRIEMSSKLPQKLRQIIEYCPGNESQTFGNVDFNIFVKNYTSLKHIICFSLCHPLVCHLIVSLRSLRATSEETRGRITSETQGEAFESGAF